MTQLNAILLKKQLHKIMTTSIKQINYWMSQLVDYWNLHLLKHVE